MMKIMPDMKTPSIQHKRSNVSSQTSFHQLVQSHSQKLNQQELKQLIDEIGKQGNRLARYRSFRDLVKFKRLVKSFLEKTVYNGLKLEHSHHFNIEGRSQQLALVKKVDEKLIELTEELMNEEKKAVDLLAIIGEIKGLLINLYI